MRHPARKVLAALFAIGWAAAFAAGAVRLWHFDSTAGEAAQAPAYWASDTHLSRNPSLPTLLLSIHPQCPCSRATLSELARLMTNCQGKVHTVVLVVRPAGVAAGWERTD